MISKTKSLVEDYKLLLRNVPALVTCAFLLSTILMNLSAAKIVFTFAGANFTGGFFLSFMPFLCMDCTAKRFGARAAILLNILSAVGNVFTVLFLHLVALIPGTGGDYTAFNSVYASVWFIVLGSTVAFVVSGVINSLLNSAIGKLFKNKTSIAEFSARSFISTFIGQAIDNFLFLYIVYGIFAPIYWDISISAMSCLITGIIGGLVELALEIVFSPLGYKIVRKWDAEGVGNEYIEAHKK